VDLKTMLVFRGFLELSPREQKQFVSELYKFLWEKEESPLEAGEFSEASAIAMGRFHGSGVCPCCGGAL
jgi:hypothetical protein